MQHVISNNFQHSLNQRFLNNSVPTKFSHQIVLNKLFSTQLPQHNFLNKISQPNFLNFFSTFSQQNILNKIFSTFLNIFSTQFVEKMLRKCSFLQKEAFSQQIFLNKFSQHFSTLSQQNFSTRFPQQTILNKFSTHFSTNFAVFFWSYKWPCRVGNTERGREDH